MHFISLKKPGTNDKEKSNFLSFRETSIQCKWFEFADIPLGIRDSEHEIRHFLVEEEVWMKKHLGTPAFEPYIMRHTIFSVNLICLILWWLYNLDVDYMIHFVQLTATWVDNDNMIIYHSVRHVVIMKDYLCFFINYIAMMQINTFRMWIMRLKASFPKPLQLEIDFFYDWIVYSVYLSTSLSFEFKTTSFP